VVDNSAAKADSSDGAAFRALAYSAQFFFGGWFLVHGLNHWMHFFPQPPGSSPIAKALIIALIDSGLFTVVKGMEVVTGIMLLANRLVPLSIVLAFPIGVSIAFLDYAANPDLFGKATAIIIMLLLAIMAVSRFGHFAPMLAFKAEEPGLGGVQAFLDGSEGGH
jgi:hypothetical protein